MCTIDPSVHIDNSSIMSQPQTTVSQPQTMVSQPSSTVSHPQSTLSQPSTMAQCQTTASRLLSTLSQIQSTVSQPQSTVSQSSTTVSQSNQTVSQSQSTLSQPQSTMSLIQSTLSQPQPTLSPPQSILSQAQSTVSQAQSTVSQPQSTLSQSYTTVSQPNQTGSSASAVQFDMRDQIILRLNKMVRECAQPVLLKVFKAETHSFASTQSFMTYLQKHKGFSNAHLKIVNSTQRKIVQNDYTGDSYDVSLLHVALTLLRSHLQNDITTGKMKLVELQDTLQDNLMAIKKFRNDLMHLQCTDKTKDFCQEFVTKTEILRTHLGEILESLKDVYKVDDSEIQKALQCVNDDINFIRDCPLTPLDIQQYQDQLLFSALSQLVINSGVGELKCIYEKWSYVSPLSFVDGFNSFLEVGVVFTRLEIKESGKDSKNKDIDYRGMFEFLQNMPSHQSNSEKEVIFIEGPAGSGKTTLTKMLLHDWSAGKNTIKGLMNFDLLIHMECRNSSNNSFLQLLKSLMPQTTKKIGEDDLITCITNFKVLFLIDGFDELNESSINVVREILNLPWSCNATITCTSRPERTKDFYKMIPHKLKIAHMKVLGIADDQRIEFVEKYHNELIKTNQSNQSTAGLIDYLKLKTSHLHEHLRLPLNLVMITLLWALAPGRVNRVTSASQLYIQILNLSIEKLIERLKCKDETQVMTTDQLKDKIEVFLQWLNDASLKSLRKDNIILTAEVTKKLQDICDLQRLPKDEITGAFLVKKTMWTQVGMNVYASFPHKSIQEFYAAQHLFSILKNPLPKVDFTNFQKDIQPVMEKHGFPPLLSDSINDTIKSMLESAGSADSSLSLSEKVENECLKDASTKSLSKYQNVFVHLFGLMYNDDTNVDKETVNEMVQLLVKTELKNPKYIDQWLDIWVDSKFDDKMASCMAQHIPKLTSGDLKINDSNVDTYTRILPYYSSPPHAKPGLVWLDLNKPDSPSLPSLLDQLISLHVSIYMKSNHQFRHPNTFDADLDEKLQLSFEKCRVLQFIGHVSSDAVRKLRPCINNLSLAITDKVPNICETLDSLTTHLDPDYLEIHVPAGTSLDVISAMPKFSSSSQMLYISDITSQHLDWVYKALRKLQLTGRNGRYLLYLSLPRSTLSEDELNTLLDHMNTEGVKINDSMLGGVYVPGDRRRDYKQSGYNIKSNPDTKYW